jgi:hypothetical protein
VAYTVGPITDTETLDTAGNSLLAYGVTFTIPGRGTWTKNVAKDSPDVVAAAANVLGNFEALLDALYSIPGVTSVTDNPLTDGAGNPIEGFSVTYTIANNAGSFSVEVPQAGGAVAAVQNAIAATVEQVGGIKQLGTG